VSKRELALLGRAAPRRPAQGKGEGFMLIQDAVVRTDFKSVDEYIASQPEAVQGVLERVRSAIRKAVPGAEEVISYKIPTHKLRGSAVIYFAGWKQHCSLYPATDRVVAALKDDLAPYEVKKSTIRFPLSQPVPVKLIERIAKLRAKEVTRESEGRHDGITYVSQAGDVRCMTALPPKAEVDRDLAMSHSCQKLTRAVQ
jgi:uncharacterized protein YdhG (YjbR/CyaY superfamily)